MKYLIAILLISACGPTKPYQYELVTGKRLNCREWQREPCGMSLRYCDDGHHYECQTHVKIKDEQ